MGSFVGSTWVTRRAGGSKGRVVFKGCGDSSLQSSLMGFHEPSEQTLNVSQSTFARDKRGKLKTGWRPNEFILVGQARKGTLTTTRTPFRLGRAARFSRWTPTPSVTRWQQALLRFQLSWPRLTAFCRLVARP